MRYNWQDANSTVQELVFVGKSNKEVREAIIYAPENPQLRSRIADLDQKLVDKGFGVSYDVIDGRHALRVTGFRAENELLEALEKTGSVAGAVTTSATDQEAAKSTVQQLKENSLILSAAFYMLGNAITMLGGMLRRDKDEFRTGVAFTVGDSTMLLFGKRNRKEKYDAMMHGFGEVLEKNGFLASTGSGFSAAASNEPPSMFGKLKGFMYDKVIAIKSISEITAGVSFARAGITQNNSYKTLAGTAIATGFGLGLTIDEKNDAMLREEFGVKTQAEVAQKLGEMPWYKRALYAIQRKPLILSGSFAATNNILTLMGASDEAKHQRKRAALEAQIGSETNPQKEASYTVKLPWATKVENVEKTAHWELQEATSALNSARAGSVEHLKAQQNFDAAQKRMDHLQQEYHNVTVSPYPNLIKAENFWMVNVAQALAMFTGNIFYAMSSKGGGGKDSEAMANSFLAAAATDILRTAPENRAEVINLAAKYAGTTRDLNITAAEARTKLEEKIQQIAENSPWVQKWQLQSFPESNAVLRDQPVIVIAPEIQNMASPVEEHPLTLDDYRQIAAHNAERKHHRGKVPNGAQEGNTTHTPPLQGGSNYVSRFTPPVEERLYTQNAPQQNGSWNELAPSRGADYKEFAHNEMEDKAANVQTLC